jgi:hypothetical protein
VVGEIRQEVRRSNIAMQLKNSILIFTEQNLGRGSMSVPGHFHHCPSVGFWSASAVSHRVEGKKVPRGASCAAAKVRAYSMTSSARASSADGTVSPSALAVLRLITSSTFVTCCTGRSAGFSPLRMRPV